MDYRNFPFSTQGCNKAKVKVFLQYIMQAQRGSRRIIPPIITSAPDGGRWSARSPGRFTPG